MARPPGQHEGNFGKYVNQPFLRFGISGCWIRRTMFSHPMLVIGPSRSFERLRLFKILFSPPKTRTVLIKTKQNATACTRSWCVIYTHNDFHLSLILNVFDMSEHDITADRSTYTNKKKVATLSVSLRRYHMSVE